MPIIVNSEDVKVTDQGKGWTKAALVDAQIIGTPAMVACRWALEPNTRGPQLVQGDTDQLLYVICGSGTAIVDGEEFPLVDESVLWLEFGEQYQFIAGKIGLEILQGYAPGE